MMESLGVTKNKSKQKKQLIHEDELELTWCLAFYILYQQCMVLMKTDIQEN